MKAIHASITFLAVLVMTAACQRAANDQTRTQSSSKRGVAMIELADQSLVDMDCLVRAAKANVDPKLMCPTVQKSQLRGVSDSREVAGIRGTCKKQCGDSNYYYCNTGNCGWNDFYGNPYYTTYYYYYNPAQLPNNWYQPFGIPANYYNRYVYSYQYSYQYQYQPYPSGSSCNNTWNGGDYTRYGNCWSGWFWK